MENQTVGEVSMPPEGTKMPPWMGTFGDAINALKLGNKVTRSGWNGKGMWVKLQTPTEFSKMTLPYLYMCTVDGHLVPWLASQTDMLAEDWEMVE